MEVGCVWNTYLLANVLNLLLHSCVCVDLSYHVEEESSPFTFVGDIAADTQMEETDSLVGNNFITYNQMQQQWTENSHLFNVTQDGKLYTAQTLDAEKLCTYESECVRYIKVAVHRRKTFLKIIKIKVIIEDINDHSPEFPQTQLNITYDEDDGEGAERLIPEAFDKDVGMENSEVTYKLKKQFSDPFILSVRKTITGGAKIGIVLGDKLDREIQDSYNLEVIANDGGQPSKQGILHVHIKIIDVNDNSPVFSKHIYNISIKNTHPNNNPILTLSAKDPDSGNNGKVSYFMSSKTPERTRRHFRLNQQTGELFVEKPLTSQTKNILKMYVEAKDGGNPSLNSFAIVRVNILNEKNHPPKIGINFVSELKKDTAAIYEGTKVGSYLAYVNVVDNDFGANGEVSCKLEHDKVVLSHLGSKEYKITLKKPLDREKLDHFNMRIVCEDNGSPALKTERKISIQVMDVNDVQPQFTKDTFHFLTYENGKANFPIGFINATDPDLASAGQLTFSLLSKDRNNIPFQVSDYGFITSNIPLDREEEDMYKFEVFVKDNGKPSLNNTANVVVEVLDRNDNNPYFIYPTTDPFHINVHYHPQSTNAITVIRASDRDSHLNAFLKYGILDGNNKRLFTLNSLTGQMSFSRAPHLNDAGSYELVLVVKDSGSPVLSATTTVSLSLRVTNKTSAPMPTVHLEKNRTLDVPLLIILVVAAVIVAVVIVVSITLCIVKCSSGQSRSAKNTRKGVNRSAICNRIDQPLPCQSSSIPGTPVRYSSEMNNRNMPFVECKEDFYPQYESQIDWSNVGSLEKSPPNTILLPTRIKNCVCVDLSYHVEEESSPFTFVGDIAADTQMEETDSLVGNNFITYNQMQQQWTENSHLFNVTQDGKLYTAQTLDAEKLCTYESECVRYIKVAVHRRKTFLKVIKIKVIIEDINDHSPEFPQKEINMTFDERDGEGAEELIPDAFDKDVGMENSEITYKLKKQFSDPFILSVRKTITGGAKIGIILGDKLDREIQDSYNLEVIANDGGQPSKQGILHVHIKIIDVNDNSPVFSQHIYNISIKNTHPNNNPILTLSAKDPDSGNNGKVSYFFSSKTPERTRQYFRLNQQTGELFVEKPLTSQTKNILKMYVEAKDGGNPSLNSFAIVRVNILNEKNHPPKIGINFVSELKKDTAAIYEGTKVGRSKEYKITLKKPLDRETLDHFNMRIVCEDNGSPALKMERKISIQVMDVNDVQPQFTKDTFHFLTYENGKANFPIGFINATDPDLASAGQLTFSLLSKDRNNIPFQVSDYGFITSNIPLDREEEDMYKFEVFVKDNGKPSLNNTANVVVEVLDRNDNNPYFIYPTTDPFHINVHYHPQSTNAITVIRASDSDSHLNAFLKYGILDGNNKRLFTLNSLTGQMSFSRAPHLNDAGSYELVLVVKDSGSPVLSATTTVSLSLRVTNKTSAPMPTVHLEKNRTLDVPLLIILVVAAVIVAVVIVVSITLCIVKCSSGQSRSAKNARKGVNRSAICNRIDQPLPCQSSSIPGTPVRYSSEMNNRNMPFVECKEDFYPQYESQIDWSNVGTLEKSPPNTILHSVMEVGCVWNTYLLANVLNLLLHSCVCVDLSYHVEEESSPFTFVGDIAADTQMEETDSLVGNNFITYNQIQRQRTGNSHLFNVTQDGKLYTAQTLDAEKLCTYESDCVRYIKVAVRRRKTFLKVIKIKVIIEDINDHSPEFPQPDVEIIFNEEDREGAERLIPDAIDRDVGMENSEVTYKLKKQFSDPFILSVKKTITGRAKIGIILGDKLDREIKDSYNLEVIANDGGQPSKQGILHVHIKIIDVNDNSPVFSKHIYNISIKNTHPNNNPILTLSAKDPDSGNNGKVSYFFSPETPERTRRHFRLNKQTGELFVEKPLTSQTKNILKMYVEAKDGGNPSLNSFAIVRMNILNEKNHPPEIDINFVSELKKGTAAIYEGTKVGSYLAYVNVVDNDFGANGEVSCKLEHDTVVLSHLGSKEYKITLKKSLDREKLDHFNMRIVCEDNGSPALKTERKISIQVMDVNDVQPQFTKDTFHFLTYENGKANFPIGFINATDPDLASAGQLTFSLLSKDRNNIPFQVSDYGFITSNIPLDREEEDMYKFEVFVKDNGKPSLNNTANVVVEVLDRNDNNPYFIYPTTDPFHINVHYHPQSTNAITVIRASDRDSHLNAFLKYGILDGNNKRLFTLNSLTGQMSFSRAPHLNDAGSYELVLVVKDSGSPVLSATTTVSLSLRVTNKTSAPMPTVHLEKNRTLDVPLLIILVVAAVIVAVVIVVSITLCIVKCSSGQSRSAKSTRKGVNRSAICNRIDQPLPCQSSSIPGTPVRYSSEMNNRNMPFVECKEDFYPQYESQIDWSNVGTLEKSPPNTILNPCHRLVRYIVLHSSHVTTIFSLLVNGILNYQQELKNKTTFLPRKKDIVTQTDSGIFFSYVVGSVKLDANCVCVDLSYHVEEESSPFTFVGDIAADTQMEETDSLVGNNFITYNQMQQQWTENSHLFNVTQDGKLYTAQTLDAEKLCTYESECVRYIKVAVRRRKTFLKIIKIQVIIEDINDHSPEFAQTQLNITFDERDGEGAERLIPDAFDKDVGMENSEITYKLKKQFSDPFILSVRKTITGRAKIGIILGEKLDREIKDSYNLEVIANDGGQPSKEGILHVHIKIIDVNDNSPIFSKHIYNISIKNTHPNNNPILTLSAKDPDSGNNGKVSYFFSPETPERTRRHFRLNQQTGELFVEKPLSQTKNILKMYVEAKDGGNPSLNSFAIVRVNILNEKNHPPKIGINFVSELKKDTAAIYEGTKVGSFLAYVNVVDNDFGANGEVSCKLEHDKVVLSHLGSKEYKITLKKPLDRETLDHFNMRIVCEDNGSPALKTERKISIQVMDVNDVQPQFTKDTFHFLTYENGKANFPIGFINATDPDLASAGQLTFSLLSKDRNNIPFQVSDYGFITSNIPLDREEEDMYKFEVFVKDNGKPSLNNTANVVVEVLDRNDNNPYFIYPTTDPFHINVHYHPQSTNAITVIRASDRDSHLNAFLKYGILDGNNKRLFTLNSLTGQMSFSRAPHLNDAGSYALVLVVKDSGSPVLSATTTVSLSLRVTNKTSAPMPTVHLEKNRTLDVPLLIILVVAAVIVAVVIVVSITLCIVKCSSGQSRSAKSTRKGVNRSAICNRIDQPLPCQSSSIPGTPVRYSSEMNNRNMPFVECKEDFYPQYESQIDWSNVGTLEKSPPNTILPPMPPIQISGKYNCEWIFDEVIYRTAQKFQYKTTRYDLTFCDGKCVRFIKVALRKKKTFLKIIKIKVIIEDINDHSPEFPQSEINLTFGERDGEGAEGLIPEAFDKDIGMENSEVTYKLKKQFSDPFILSVRKTITGGAKIGIILGDKLDREMQDSYNLEVIANDGGQPSKQGILHVHIKIIDVNDNSPVFSKHIYNISIKNTHPNNNPILTLSAKDPDSGNNGKVSYFLSSKTPERTRQYFRLNQQTGELFVEKPLTSQTKNILKMYVEAKDGGNPSLNSFAIVRVNILNEKNHAPEIDIDFVSELKKDTAAIYEGTKVGSYLAYVNVVDNDVGANGEVSCKLEHDKVVLSHLGSKEYKITLKKPLDREKLDHFNMRIVCEDNGSPALKTERKISIQVMDVNDVQPQFTKDTFHFLTYENGKANFPIGFINATDPDLASAGQLTFSLLSKDRNNIPFQVSDYGFITSNIPLDREEEDMYKFEVFVKDNGKPSLNNTANVVVEVLDRNDNNPYFIYPTTDPFHINVHYHPQSTNAITVIRASDRDSHLNAFLKYGILDGNNKRLFTLNSLTGQMSFSRAPHLNDAGSYELVLVVKDSGSPVLSATTTVSLSLRVTNKTSAPMPTVHLEKNRTLDVPLLIILVVAAVIVAVVIVVSITLCIVKCSSGQSRSAKSTRKGVNRSAICNRIDQPLPCQSSSIPGTPVRYSSEMNNRNMPFVECKEDFYPQYESQIDWSNVGTLEKSPPNTILLPTRIKK
ncbi:cadherin-23-like [Octopus sinensis]|uniref:Cadherin-23-like n=1 Tax=Octopus sinensis TaxID=2607531 RepID=A0A7E6FC09_9MOLL|nr:cadherin-23-like [Octopus sinensis]